MNRSEAAEALRQRNVRWPNTPVVDVASEVDVWVGELAAFPLSLVEEVLRMHAGGFALTVNEVRERCQARTPRLARPTGLPAAVECPTCGRSPFGPHRGVDPCRTCGRDEAPEYARMQPTPIEETAP